MKLLTFNGPDGLKLGIRSDQGVIDVVEAGAALGVTVPQSLTEVITGGDPAVAELQVLEESVTGSASGSPWLLDEMGLQHGPVVANPGKIICVGLNYRRHAQESNLPVPETPVLFSKFGNTICGSGADVPLPSVATEFDYEVELGFVIGKSARNVSQEHALSYVLGYCTANDVSVRDLQTRTSQWLLGKTLDNFLPIGPYLVTADEVGDPQSLRIRCWVNGDLRQDSNTGDMIFSVAEIISYISRYFTLEPGDVVVTGTPEGVAMGRADKPWLKPGDEVIVEVERLGQCRNMMIA
jgi:2-keto-4-pentenoate hydratase/2-oxohepta-3-ene-1,7-dioic acid hydratase in catechol pathway